MPATGFRRIPRDELSDEHCGRIWRVNLRNGEAFSQGNKYVERIVYMGQAVIVRRRDEVAAYPLKEIESILVETNQPVQRRISAWGEY